MNQKRQQYITTLLVVTLIGGAFFYGREVGRVDIESTLSIPVGSETGKPVNVDFASFWKVWNTINDKFVTSATSTTDKEKVWGAIQGLAGSLNDPYTVFFPPVESKMFQEEITGSFEGVGMEIGIKDGLLTVVAPLKNTPAERAGIRSGDRIMQINDRDALKMKTDEAIKLIRGPRGTTVRLLIAREGRKDTIEIAIVRDTITIPTIETEQKSQGGNFTADNGVVVKDGVYVIRLFSFSSGAPQLFRNALKQFLESGNRKLIIDLRNNPGGYMDAAVDIASWFLPEGAIVVKEEFGKNKESHEYRSRGYYSMVKDAYTPSFKMAILVNGGSASASEILAGALREHGVATLVGEKTFGKGSVQELVTITPETSFKVTVARWFTPNGISISHSGLTPDVVVKITEEDLKKSKDPQLDKAVEVLNKK